MCLFCEKNFDRDPEHLNTWVVSFWHITASRDLSERVGELHICGDGPHTIPGMVYPDAQYLLKKLNETLSLVGQRLRMDAFGTTENYIVGFFAIPHPTSDRAVDATNKSFFLVHHKEDDPRKILDEVLAISVLEASLIT